MYATSRPVLRSLISADPPPGWEDDNTLTIATQIIRFLECTRIQIDALERGPAKVLLETYTDSRAPDSCRDDRESGPPEIITNVLFDDAGLADYARDRLDLASELGDFSKNQGPMQDAKVTRWVVKVDNNPGTTLNFPEAGQGRTPTEDHFSLFWETDGTVTELEVDVTSDMATPQVYPVWGTVAPPLAATETLPMWDGLNIIRYDTKIETHIITYEDPSCARN